MPIPFHIGKDLFNKGWECTAVQHQSCLRSLVLESLFFQGKHRLSSCQPPSWLVVSSPHLPTPVLGRQVCRAGLFPFSEGEALSSDCWPCSHVTLAPVDILGRQKLNLIPFNLVISIPYPPFRLSYYAWNLVLGILEAVVVGFVVIVVGFVVNRWGKSCFSCGKSHISLDILGSLAHECSQNAPPDSSQNAPCCFPTSNIVHSVFFGKTVLLKL